MCTCGQGSVCVCVPAVRCVCVWQQRDDSVAQTFTQRTQELSVLDVVAGVTTKTLLTSLLLQLHSLKVPEHKQVFNE